MQVNTVSMSNCKETRLDFIPFFVRCLDPRGVNVFMLKCF